MSSTTLNPISRHRTLLTFARSQILLFKSRMKWGIVYSLATIAGLFLVQGSINSIYTETNPVTLAERVAPLPIISLLMTTGLFLLNDLLDIELDKVNGKRRPLPSGEVSKNQARIFIVWTTVLALGLSAMTGNYASMLLVIPMLVIGIMYSAPKIALDDRFVAKTISISVYYMLCATLGATSAYGIGYVLSNPIVFIHAVIILGAMRFISSVLNDTGDVEGDRAAGRRTIPIVLGRENTIKVSILVVFGMAAISWMMYLVGSIGIVTTLFTNAFAVLLATRLAKTIKGARNRDFVRKQHRRLVSFDMMLLIGLPIGVLLI